MQKVVAKVDLTLIAPPGNSQGNLLNNQFNNIINFVNFEEFKISEMNAKKIKKTHYDLVILTYDSSRASDYKKLISFSNQINKRKQVMMDLNMSISIRKGQMQRYLKTLKENRIFYIQEPSLILFEFLKIFKTLFKQIKFKFFDKIGFGKK